MKAQQSFFPHFVQSSTHWAPALMFISVPFDKLLHFIMTPGFQVGDGDDSFVPLKPFPKRFGYAVFDTAPQHCFPQSRSK